MTGTASKPIQADESEGCKAHETAQCGGSLVLLFPSQPWRLPVSQQHAELPCTLPTPHLDGKLTRSSSPLTVKCSLTMGRDGRGWRRLEVSLAGDELAGRPSVHRWSLPR